MVDHSFFSTIQILGNVMKIRWRSVRSGWSWGGGVFWLLCITLLTLMLCFAMMLRSEQGIVAGMSLLRSKDTAQSFFQDAFTPSPVISSASHESNGQSAFEQAQALSNLLTTPDRPLVEWLRLLEDKPVLQRPVIVHIQPLSALNERQKQLFARQNITVQPWANPSAPPSHFDLHPYSQFWVHKDGEKKWTISAIMPDLMASQKVDRHSLTDLDVVRIILWSDELLVQQQWQKQHPAPLPPVSIRPANMSVEVIPSDIGMKVIFWTSAGFVALFTAIGCMLFSLSSWDGLRKEGVLEPLAALPFPSAIIPLSYLFLWTSCLFAALLTAAALSGLILMSASLPVAWLDMIKLIALSLSLSMMVMSLSICVASWRPERWWKMWVSVGMTSVAVALQGFYVSGFSQTRRLAVLLDGPVLWGVVLGFGVIAWALCQLTGWCLDRHHRLGFKKT